jgi:hypothetical protein
VLLQRRPVRAGRVHRGQPGSAPGGSTRLLELWMPLPWSLTMVNRSMRHRDHYPFALSPRVPEKVTFVHRLASQVRDEVAAAS